MFTSQEGKVLNQLKLASVSSKGLLAVGIFFPVLITLCCFKCVGFEWPSLLLFLSMIPFCYVWYLAFKQIPLAFHLINLEKVGEQPVFKISLCLFNCMMLLASAVLSFHCVILISALCGNLQLAEKLFNLQCQLM